MKTVYIDIYFLINFCIDVLAFYYAANMAHIKIGNVRLMLLGIIGGLSAIIHILTSSGFVTVANMFVTLFLFCVLGAKSCVAARRAKFLLLFLIIQLLIGGCVSFCYSLLDRYVYPLISSIDEGVANRNALIFSVIVLFSILVIRLLILLFSSRATDTTVFLSLELEGKKYECEAFVDSGNLVRDPLSLLPVIFIGSDGIRRMGIPFDASIEKTEYLKSTYKHRIHLIPINAGGKTKIHIGMRFDKVTIKTNGKEAIIDTVIVLNKEEKAYAGYDSLVPSCLINEIQ